MWSASGPSPACRPSASRTRPFRINAHATPSAATATTRKGTQDGNGPVHLGWSDAVTPNSRHIVDDVAMVDILPMSEMEAGPPPSKYPAKPVAPAVAAT